MKNDYAENLIKLKERIEALKKYEKIGQANISKRQRFKYSKLNKK